MHRCRQVHASDQKINTKSCTQSFQIHRAVVCHLLVLMIIMKY